MEYKRVFVTPDLAAKMLESNTHNRDLKQTVVDKYASDMAKGLYQETHQGIAVADDGTILDGQHRLWAVIQSGVSVWFWICYGAEKKTQLVIDGQKPRSPADSITLSGDIGRVTNQHTSIARSMANGYLPKGSRVLLSTTDVMHFIATHREAIDFSIDVHGRCRGLTATVRSAIARAWYTQDRELLRSFVEVFVSGVCPRGPADSGATVLAKVISGFQSGAGQQIRTNIYRKAERAMQAFLSGQAVSKLYEVQSELYPIPGDEEWDKLQRRSA